MSNKVKKIMAVVIASVAGVGGLMTYPFEPVPLTVSEYHALVEMYDYEIKLQGGITLENVTIETIQDKLHEKIRGRQLLVNEEEYGVAREILLQKVEKTSLLERII